MLSSRSCPVVLPCNERYQEYLEGFARNCQGWKNGVKKYREIFLRGVGVSYLKSKLSHLLFWMNPIKPQLIGDFLVYNPA